MQGTGRAARTTGDNMHMGVMNVKNQPLPTTSMFTTER